MLGAVTEHYAEPELWRRYLALVLDGMRDRPDLLPLPELACHRASPGAISAETPARASAASRPAPPSQLRCLRRTASGTGCDPLGR
jgi:hypothetical protein